jgi:molybdate transport system substrate-binding protein
VENKLLKLFRSWLRTALSGVIISALLLAGCSGPRLPRAEKLQAEQHFYNDSAGNSEAGIENQSGKTKPVILIAAAASLEPVMKELETLYMKKDRPADLSFSFSSSGALQLQIEQGAPVDVYISAAAGNMNILEQQGLVYQDSRFDLLQNELVLIGKSDTSVGSFADLSTDKAVHIGLGSPDSVPAGAYAEQVISSLNLKQAISSKTVFAKDVTELIFWVQGGHVDAALVYMTDAAFRDDLKVICKAPAGSHDEIIYPAALIAGSKYQDEGRDFLNFLQSEAACLIFEKYGFTKPDK